eukprot:1156011-Pelagomonas_calceolata.AAC.3
MPLQGLLGRRSDEDDESVNGSSQGSTLATDLDGPTGSQKKARFWLLVKLEALSHGLVLCRQPRAFDIEILVIFQELASCWLHTNIAVAAKVFGDSALTSARMLRATCGAEDPASTLKFL